MSKQENIEKITIEAKEKLESLSIEEKLVSEIEWCLGSYASDHNPAGLYKKTEEAFKVLKSYKRSKPRKISKKLLDDIEKTLSS